MEFKFIHAADIHLDSPLVGLARYEGAPVKYVRTAAREAFNNLINLALQEKVSFLVIAGDLYDGDWKDYNTGLFFAAQMTRLREARIRAFIVRGNHDAASQITKHLSLPDNVKEMSCDSPEVQCLDDIGVAIHGQGFSKAAVTEDLSRNYPDPLQGYLNIGVLHTCASGREGHESYAPCDINSLAVKGYDYWALGHVHKREVLKKDPWIVFPGNIQGRHIRETGSKGCSLVSVKEGRIEAVQHRNLDILRWSLCEINASGAADLDDILERAKQVLEPEIAHAEGRLLAVRFLVSGACSAHDNILTAPESLINNLRQLATDLGAGHLWVEKVKIDTRRLVSQEEVLSLPPVESLVQYIRELANDEGAVVGLLAEFAALKKALPPELYEDDGISLKDSRYLQGLLPQVEELLLSRLRGKEALAGDI